MSSRISTIETYIKKKKSTIEEQSYNIGVALLHVPTEKQIGTLSLVLLYPRPKKENAKNDPFRQKYGNNPIMYLLF